MIDLAELEKKVPILKDIQNEKEVFWISATRSQTVKSLRTSNGFPLFGELVV